MVEIPSIESEIRKVITNYIENEAERVIEQSKAVLEARLKEVLAKAAVQLTNHFDVERYANKIIISFQIKE